MIENLITTNMNNNGVWLCLQSCVLIGCLEIFDVVTPNCQQCVAETLSLKFSLKPYRDLGGVRVTG